MNTFELNGKKYIAKDIDFNMICDLEEEGLSLEDIEKKPMSMIRTYIAICMNASKDLSGKEIEQHLINGGTLSDVADVMGRAMENSGFFQAISKGTEKETATVPKKTGKKKPQGEIIEISET